MDCFKSGCQSCDVFDIPEAYGCAVMWRYMVELMLLALSLCPNRSVYLNRYFAKL